LIGSNASLATATSHYGSTPYEALFEGYFLDAASARQYLALWASSAKEPYHKVNLEANSMQLMELVSRLYIETLVP
jgi:hypothetical protein